MDVVMEPGQGTAATTGWGTSAAGQGVGGGHIDGDRGAGRGPHFDFPLTYKCWYILCAHLSSSMLYLHVFTKDGFNFFLKILYLQYLQLVCAYRVTS